MGISSKQLTSGEHVVLAMRTHVKKIFGPILLLIAMLALVAAALIWLPQNDFRQWLLLAIGIAALLIVIVWVLVPIWRWRSQQYVITNRRLITRSGILTKSGRDIPLFRINDVSYEKGLLDRVLGCGTLVVSDASEQVPLRLTDVPRVEHAQVTLHELLFSQEDGADDDGAYAPGEPRMRARGRRGGAPAYGGFEDTGYDPRYDESPDYRSGYEQGLRDGGATRPLPRQEP
ncbi:PH domain-containing protein [Calidifontibacter sp. DB0510]|uniref:PH domain-containing protein n=1 Tax=Metallococcus carri TaxID=1656884 RepID=A0A967E834_9MICO|nr:PH domain-containing protein [Metallococcus carri]NHN54797.1 PH domain-containing protein [Metallococcus carri]NOP37142.1 PH domain-containing protein [Calidifontibacter sp. DB2511S]